MKSEYLLNYISILNLFICCIIGLWRWNYLSVPLRIFELYFGVYFIICIASVILMEMNLYHLNQVSYPVSAATESCFLGLFYLQLFQNRTHKFFIFLGFFTALLYVIYDFMTAGIQPVNLKLMNMPAFLSLVLAVLLIRKLLLQYVFVKRMSLFWVLVSNALYALYELMYNYIFERLPFTLNNELTYLLFCIVTPIVNIIAICLVLYAFILTKKEKTTFDKIPNLDDFSV